MAITIDFPTSSSGGATLAANTFTGAQVITANGAASTPGLHITGVPFAGTGTTSFPQLYVNDSAATASTVLNTAGTMFGVNANGAQDLMNLLKDGASRCKVDTDGNVTAASTISAGSYFFTSDAVYAGGALGASQFYAAAIGVVLGSSTHVAFTNGTAIGGTKDLYAVRAAAAHLKLGLLHATTATNQTFSAHNVTTGTGAALTLAGGTGTTTPGSQLILGGGIGGTGASTITAKVSSGGATTTIFTVAEDGITIGDNLFINAGTTSGLTIASSTSQKLGFWGTSPAVQGAAITDVSSAPSVTGFDTVSQANLESVLASYGTAINDILTRLRNPGFIAT